MKWRKKKTHSIENDRGELLRPRAAAMIESMRDIGYSLESAVADIVDNAITAKARVVSIRAGFSDDGLPWLAVIDDGTGMTPDELVEAMRPGARNPLDTRPLDDLGRFGLGLKTASFSQCRKLTVVTRTQKHIAAKQWDVDFVAKHDEWLILTPSADEVANLQCHDDLPVKGTMVLWERLDRLDLGPTQTARDVAFNERLTAIREHLALVFHRFLSPEGKGRKAVSILINNRPVEPFDPFNARHPSTDALPLETIDIGGVRISLQPFILPHHTKTTQVEYERLAGVEGYLRSQGFYVYRNRRLIIHGTWFRLAKQEELTKLARVRVDIPNTLDHLWNIDVRKSRAQPPEVVRRRMRVVLEQIRASAKRPYTHRGTVIQKRDAAPVWLRREFNSRITYTIDPEHPLLEEFRADLPSSARESLNLLLKMIESSFPAPLFFNDMASAPARNDIGRISDEHLSGLAAIFRASHRDLTHAEFKKRLQGIEPFASHPDFVANYSDSTLEGNA